MDSDEQTIYEQDCQFVRYHDGLMWSRLQTAMAVEGAMLYGLYGGRLAPGALERPALAAAGLVFVFFACLLAFTDRADVRDHMARIRKFEACNAFMHSKRPYLKAPIFLGVIGISLLLANIAIFASQCIMWVRFR